MWSTIDCDIVMCVYSSQTKYNRTAALGYQAVTDAHLSSSEWLYLS